MLSAAIEHVGVVGGPGALAGVALKVGALSYGGGFVIVPLVQYDVVSAGLAVIGVIAGSAIPLVSAVSCLALAGAVGPVVVLSGVSV